MVWSFCINRLKSKALKHININDTHINQSINDDKPKTKPKNNDLSDIVIRCCWCSKKFNIYDIEQHELICTVKFPSVVNVECSYCTQKINIDTIETHEITCKNEQFIKNITQNNLTLLLPIQIKALQYIQTNSKHLYDTMGDIIRTKLDLSHEDYNTLLINFNACVQLINFHSAHLTHFEKDTYYRNRFETNSSSGTMCIQSRKRWENNMFNSIYNSAKPHERCKYGILNIKKELYVMDAAIYGESYFILKPEVKYRSTLTFNDSSTGGKTYSFEHPHHFFLSLPKAIIRAIIDQKQTSAVLGAYYIETQIHGDVIFNRDILAMVADDKHIATDMENNMRSFCEKNNILFQWKYQIQV